MEPFKNEFNLYEWFTQGWQKEKDDGPYRRRGDIINHTAKKIIADNDRSEWARKAIRVCVDLLKERKRWPDGMGAPIIECTTRAGSWYYKQKWNILKWWYRKVLKVNPPTYAKDPLYKHRYKPRWQRDMTRDPYIAVIAACVHLGEIEWIKEISIPGYCWRQPTWAWHHFLKDATHKRLNRYEWYEKRNTPPSGFATRLQQIRIDAKSTFILDNP